MIKLKIHSFVDVITNSSTTIYSYYSGSIKPVKEMIDAFLEAFKSSLKADDLFYFGVFCNLDTYEDYHNDLDDEEKDSDFTALTELDYTETKLAWNKFILNIMKGDKVKPQWMTQAEEKRDYSGYYPEDELYIVQKINTPEYTKLAQMIDRAISSPSHEAFRDG